MCRKTPDQCKAKVPCKNCRPEAKSTYNRDEVDEIDIISSCFIETDDEE